MQQTFISKKYVSPEKVPDDFRAFLTEGARYTPMDEYPCLESWMIPEDIEDHPKVIPFDEAGHVSNLNDYYICFYCRDSKFNSVLRNPNRYIPLFRRTKGIIGFDYSVYEDMPIIKQKAQINDNLSLSFFYGIRNIKIIPNIRVGAKCTENEFLKAIPRKTVVALGSYGCIRSRDEKKVYQNFLRDMLPALEPKAVLVYGAMPEVIFKEFSEQYRFCVCPPYIDIKMKGGK